MVIVIMDGDPGSGKTTLASQFCYYLTDGKFCLKDIVYDFPSFDTKLNNAKVGDAILLDEAYDTLNKKKTMSQHNFQIIGKLQRTRIKRVFIFILLPNVYDLDKRFVTTLPFMYINIQRKDLSRKRKYAMWRREEFRPLIALNDNIFIRPKKIKIYDTSPVISGERFRNWMPFDVNEYNKQKEEAYKNMYKAENESKLNKYEQKYMTQRNKLIRAMRDDGKTVKEIGVILGCNYSTVIGMLKSKEITLIKEENNQEEELEEDILPILN
jgi:adenylate kinase family enzyme